jgi:hypothetical protein
VAKQAKSGFVLPLWEVFAQFAGQDGGSTKAEIGDVSTEFGVGFLPLLGHQGDKFLQQTFGFFAKESIHRYHKWREVSALLEASLNILLLSFAFVSY